MQTTESSRAPEIVVRPYGFITRSPSGLQHGSFKLQRLEIQSNNKRINDSYRIALTDIFIEQFRKQTGLLPTALLETRSQLLDPRHQSSIPAPSHFNHANKVAKEFFEITNFTVVLVDFKVYKLRFYLVEFTELETR